MKQSNCKNCGNTKVVKKSTSVKKGASDCSNCGSSK